MSKFSKVPTEKILDQLDFFSQNLPSGSLDIQQPLRKSISTALSKSTYSRDHIASSISELVRYKVTRRMLDNYADESHTRHRIPAEIVPALCVVTGNLSPLRILAETSGAYLLAPEEAAIAKLIQVRRDRERLESEERDLETRIGSESTGDAV